MLIELIEGVGVQIINLFFITGWSLNWLLKWLKIDYFICPEARLETYDGYALFYCTPEFHLDQQL